ncbi:MAG: ABC transporter permease [Candidatus Bipolaricaulaceae bacterium]
MREFLALLAAQALIFWRNRGEAFFTLVLPLVFLTIFGFIWGGERPLVLGLALLEPNAHLCSILEGRPNLKVRAFADRESLVEAVRRRVADFGLVWNGEELEFLFEASRVQDNPAYEAVARGIARELELRLSGKAGIVKPVQVHVGRLPAADWFYYVVSGVLILPILSAGLFAVAGRIAAMRERWILHQLLVTPGQPWSLVLAIGALRLLLALTGVFVNLAFARFVFGVQFPVAWGLLLPFVLASALGAMGMGTVIALLVHRPGTAELVANAFLQGMLLLSGIYIPLEFLPAGLRVVSRFLPTTYMAQGMRYTLGVVEMNGADFWGMVAGLALFGIGLVPLLSRHVAKAGRG